MDGNGRVARLMSHAMMLDTLDTGAVWSVARGLARNVSEYKTLLANCDLPRRNHLDGRGTLSEEALVEFTRFFLNICIDQVNFMESLVQPDRLRAAFCCGRKRKSGSDYCLPNRAAFLKRCSTVESCLAGVPTPSSAPANGRPDALSRPCSARKSWFPRVLVRHCALPSPRLWHRVGCRGCSRRSPHRLRNEKQSGAGDGGRTRDVQLGKATVNWKQRILRFPAPRSGD